MREVDFNLKIRHSNHPAFYYLFASNRSKPFIERRQKLPPPPYSIWALPYIHCDLVYKMSSSIFCNFSYMKYVSIHHFLQEQVVLGCPIVHLFLCFLYGSFSNLIKLKFCRASSSWWGNCLNRKDFGYA